MKNNWISIVLAAVVMVVGAAAIGWQVYAGSGNAPELPNGTARLTPQTRDLPGMRSDSAVVTVDKFQQTNSSIKQF